MIKSSTEFSLISKEEKEISIDLLTNQKVVCVMTIQYKKCNCYCASYCLCGCKKYKLMFYNQNYNKLFKVEFKHLKSGEKFEFKMFSNLEKKTISLPKGEYLIKITENNKAYLEMEMTFQDIDRTIYLQIEF